MCQISHHLFLPTTGDLFEKEEDLEDYTLWQENSDDPEIQQQYRMEVLRTADFIVPGHGPMFKVPEEYKKQMHMVMYYEHSSTTIDGKTTEEKSCIVMEQEWANWIFQYSRTVYSFID